MRRGRQRHAGGPPRIARVTARTRNSTRTFYTRCFALAVAGVVAWLAWVVVQPVWQPLAWALVFAALLGPLQQVLAARLGDRPSAAAALLTLGVLAFVALPAAALVAALGSELAALADGGGVAPAEAAGQLSDLRALPVAGEPLDDLRRSFGVSRATVEEWLEEGFKALVAALGPLGGKLVAGVAGAVAGFVVMLVVLFFALRDGGRMLHRAGALVPWPATVKQRLIGRLDAVLRAVVLGTGLTALLQGGLVALAFAVLGLPGPLVFGTLAALLAVVPVGGTALVWGPAALYLAFREDWWQALALALWGTLLVGTIDNLLRPLLVAGRAQVGTVTIFVGVLGGLGAFGLIGVVLGPLVICLLIALLELLRRPASA